MGNVTTLNVRLPLFTRGDTYDHIVTFYNQDGTVADLSAWLASGFGVRCNFRNYGPDGTSIGTVTCTIQTPQTGATKGQMRVYVASDVAVNAVGGFLVFDFEFYNGNVTPEVKNTKASGRMRVLKDVTHS